MPASPLAALIVKARRARTALPVDPALTPSSLHAALVIQAEVAGELGEAPAGWKVGFTRKARRGRRRSSRATCGPANTNLRRAKW